MSAKPVTVTSITRKLALKSLADCTKSMSDLLAARLEIERLTTRRDMKVRESCEQFNKDVTTWTAAAIKQEDALEEYYLKNRKDIEKDGAKFCQLSNGEMGCRLGPPKLVTLGKWTWEAVLAKLQSLWPGKYVRIPDPEVDKTRVKACLTPDELKTCGMATAQTETFFANPTRPPDPGKVAA